jgi:hypothetical protein
MSLVVHRVHTSRGMLSHASDRMRDVSTDDVISFDIGYSELTVEEKYLALLLSHDFPLVVDNGKYHRIY